MKNENGARMVRRSLLHIKSGWRVRGSMSQMQRGRTGDPNAMHTAQIVSNAKPNVFNISGLLLSKYHYS